MAKRDSQPIPLAGPHAMAALLSSDPRELRILPARRTKKSRRHPVKGADGTTRRLDAFHPTEGDL
jgi:hypothetical protein